MRSLRNSVASLVLVLTVLVFGAPTWAQGKVGSTGVSNSKVAGYEMIDFTPINLPVIFWIDGDPVVFAADGMYETLGVVRSEGSMEIFAFTPEESLFRLEVTVTPTGVTVEADLDGGDGTRFLLNPVFDPGVGELVVSVSMVQCACTTSGGLRLTPVGGPCLAVDCERTRDCAAIVGGATCNERGATWTPPVWRWRNLLPWNWW